MPQDCSSDTAVVAHESSMARQQLTPAYKFANTVRETVPHCRTLITDARLAETVIGSPAARAAITQAAGSGSTTMTRGDRPRRTRRAQVVLADANPPTPAWTATASMPSSPYCTSCCSISANAVVYPAVTCRGTTSAAERAVSLISSE